MATTNTTRVSGTISDGNTARVSGSVSDGSTARVSGAIADGNVARVSGVPSEASSYRFPARLLLEGDAQVSGGDFLLLEGDSTDGDDFLLLEGDALVRGIGGTNTTRVTGI